MVRPLRLPARSSANRTPLKRAVAETQRVAQTEATVLLLGESGTGKELFRARRSSSFWPDATGLSSPSTAPQFRRRSSRTSCLATSVARSPARASGRLGKFELASSGTVFLDEIGELPLAVQGKLLRVIEEKVVDRIGGRAPVPVDVRVVAATNRDLKSGR